MWKDKQVFWEEYRDAVQGMYQGIAGAVHPLVRDVEYQGLYSQDRKDRGCTPPQLR